MPNGLGSVQWEDLVAIKVKRDKVDRVKFNSGRMT